MKLRLRGDSLRLRLTKTEVARLVEEGAVEESVSFAPGARLTYAVACGGAALSAALSAARVEVFVPDGAARAWAASEAISLETTQPAEDGRTLRILVEKDFACGKHRPREDDADAFADA